MTKEAFCPVCGMSFIKNNSRLYCSRKCQRIASRGKSKRFSGRIYLNPPEKILELREKYKNGVTEEIMKEFEENLKGGVYL